LDVYDQDMLRYLQGRFRFKPSNSILKHVKRKWFRSATPGFRYSEGPLLRGSVIPGSAIPGVFFVKEEKEQAARREEGGEGGETDQDSSPPQTPVYNRLHVDQGARVRHHRPRDHTLL